MNKYIPFRDLVLVKRIKEEFTVGGIALPDKKRTQFIKLEVIAAGPDVPDSITMGAIVYAENMYQDLDKEVGLILEKYIFAKEDNGNAN